MSQIEMFAPALARATRAFNVACATRDVYNFCTPEYYAAQADVDAAWGRMKALQGCVCRWHTVECEAA